MGDEIWHLYVVLAFCGVHVLILSFVLLRISSALRRESNDGWSALDRRIFHVSAWATWLLLATACVVAVYYRFHDRGLATTWLVAIGLGGSASTVLSLWSVQTTSRASDRSDALAVGPGTDGDA